MKRILPTVSLIGIVACAPDVPATPSFQQDVMPVLAANCLRCHGAPTIGGAPEGFRLDSFSDVIVRERLFPAGDPACDPPSPDPGCFPIVIAGAATMADTAAVRVGDDDRPMPPRFQLDDHQIELLENWAATGAGRGEPRPSNGSPTAALETSERDGPVVRLRVRVDDPDRDAVGGSLHARIAAAETFVGLVHSGVASVTWDATGIAAGSYPLFARLDDGATSVVVDLGTITVGGP
jgi:hypothetical protein